MLRVFFEGGELFYFALGLCFNYYYLGITETIPIIALIWVTKHILNAS